MRFFMIAAGCILLCGCSKTQPPLAGGKPIGHWLEALRDPDPKVRKQAVLKLGNAGPADSLVMPALIGALQDTDAGVRCEAVLALLKFGPAGRAAIPALTEAEKTDPDPKMRAYAAKALAKLQKSE